MTTKTILVSFLVLGVLAQPLFFSGGYAQGETNNFQVSVGTSTRASQFDDFAFGRMGLVFHNGRLFPVWPDNSTALGGNPDISNFDVATVPVSVGSDGTIALGTYVNVSRALGNQQGIAVALNPINPNNLVIVSNGAPGVTAPPTQGAIFRAFSTNGGTTWTTGGVIPAAADPQVVFDEFGNCFLLSINRTNPYRPTLQLHVSVDGGVTFVLVPEFAVAGLVVNAALTVGPDSVWVAYTDLGSAGASPVNKTAGAAVSGLGHVGPFVHQTLVGAEGGKRFDIAVGPTGQVMVSYENVPTTAPATINVQVDPDGLGAQSFGPPRRVTNILTDQFLNHPLPRLVYDQSNSANGGRAYLVYVDHARIATTKDILVRFSDDDGATWSAPFAVNDRTVETERLFPTLAVDGATGNLAVIWQDFRNTSGMQVWGKVLMNVTDPATPDSPLNLLPAAVTSSRVDLTWTDRSNNETGFVIERQGPNIFLGFQPLATVGPNVTSFSDGGHAPQTLLVYRVRAINASGASPYSNELGVTTLALPAVAPTNLVVTSFTSSQIELRWTDNSSNEQGFIVERSTDGVNFSELSFRPSVNSTTFTDQGLPVGATFFYRVRAFNSAGKSAPTNVVSGITDGPSALFTTAVSRSRISLSWTDNSSRESNYRVERSRDGISYTEIAVVGPNVTTFLDTGLRANTLYFYRVRGTIGGSNSGYTNYSFATTFK